MRRHARYACFAWAFLTVALLTPAASALGAAYPRLEASFNIPGLVTDPFDYVATDVRVQISKPDSTTVSLPAFFDGGTTWRVRHSPVATGLYEIVGITLNGLTASVTGLQPTSWNVSAPPLGPGFVQVDPINPSRFRTSDGRRYFPVGHNVGWWTNNANLPVAFHKMGGAHENWSRVWMMHFYDSLNLEWPKVGGFGQYSLPVAAKWDAIVSAAEQSGIYFQMVLQHHGQYSSDVDSNWNNNPYNAATGGFLSNATQFFTNATAKALSKRKYRYIIARWGYSPAIMAWELFNEVQFTDSARNGRWNDVIAWHNEMAMFIRSQDPYGHLVTTSSQLDQPIWSQCDYYQNHVYPTDLISALRDPLGVPPGQPLKPIFPGECGLHDTPQLGVSAPMWAGLMSGQSGTAQPWWWDRIEANNEYSHFRSVSDFARRSGLVDQSALAKSAPRVTCPQSTSLVFAPGGGWATASQDTFTVGEVAPDGIGTLPSFLQGNFHRNMTPNGFTFLVNYPAGGGTFSVQILTIAASGAGLRITVDNTFTNAINFPATGSDVNTNYTLSVNVTAGQHTIRLWNPGQDWVNLGNITLAPYVPMLGAYQLGNTNFAALWIWHRTNLYHPNSLSTVGGAFPLAGLQAGNYSATWWDTFNGAPLSNFNFSVSGTNSVTINIPPVHRSIAFYAGRAADAEINSPDLVRTVGTNSPIVKVPLVITNLGGLPLSWNLSVTGMNSVAYHPVRSTDPGGPNFTWKDISGIGRDLRTNFVALTAKTARDEGISGPIDLGFNFPFFSGVQSPGIFSQIYVSPNGYISFSPFGGDTSTNRPLPGVQAPTNLIAGFWDDLDLASAGHVYVAGDPIAGTFTIQFQSVVLKGTANTINCQIVLKTSGEILFLYKSLGPANGCTVGLQNRTASSGLQLAHNQNYLQNNFAIRLRPTRWLDLSAHAGLLPRSLADTIEVALDPAGLAYGTYQATLLVRTDDPAQPLTGIPIALEVSPIGTWRQVHFGSAENNGTAADLADSDGDQLSNIFEYAFNTNPVIPSAWPIQYYIVDGHLTLRFQRTRPPPSDISYVFEVSDNVLGPWQSGPAFTTQVVTDNLNNTEMVTVTDVSNAGSTAAHYVRVRVSRP